MSKFERIGEISLACITIIAFIWFIGLFFGAGKLDWWAGMLLISEIVFGLLYIIAGINSEIVKNRNTIKNTIW